MAPQMHMVRATLLHSNGLWFVNELNEANKTRRVDGEERRWAIGPDSEVPEGLSVGDCQLVLRERSIIAQPLRRRHNSTEKSRARREHPVLIRQGNIRFTPTDRIQQAANDLAEALRAWGPSPHLDIPDDEWMTHDLRRTQPVRVYQIPERQQRYAHMYAAKHLAMWSGLRLILNWKGGESKRLVSIGAGPLLDMMGWCWDASFRADKVAIDPVHWKHVLAVPAWARAVERLCGPISWSRPAYIPDGPKPSQISTIQHAKPVASKELGEGDTLLLPFVVNHLLDSSGSVDDGAIGRLAVWLKDVASRGARVAIADMHDPMDPLWNTLLDHLGVRCRPRGNFVFAGLMDRFAELYPPNAAGYRTYTRYRNHCVARVLVHDGKRWCFMEDDVG